MNKFILLLAVILISTPAIATEKRNIISVQGKGAMKTIPNIADIFITLYGEDKIAVQAKIKSDKKNVILNKIAKRLNLEKKNIKIIAISLQPKYIYNTIEKKQIFDKFQSQIVIKITLYDIKKIDNLLDSLVNGGINRISNIKYRTSQIKKLKIESLKKATINAKNKALAIVESLGNNLGRPVYISESSAISFPRRRNFASAKMMAMSANNSSSKYPAGEIEIKTNVNIKFLIK